MLDRADKLRGLQEAVMGPGIEPGITAAKFDYVKFALFEIAAVDVGDLQFPARGRTQACGDIENGIVIEIESGDRPIREKLVRFFDNIDRLLCLIELQDTILAWLVDVVGENSRAMRARPRLSEFGTEPVAIEHIVTQDERNAVAAHELASENKCVC